MDPRSAGKETEETKTAVTSSSQSRVLYDGARTSEVPLPELSSLRVCDTPNPEDEIPNPTNALRAQPARGQEVSVNQLTPMVRIVVSAVSPSVDTTGTPFDLMDMYLSPNPLSDIPTSSSPVSLSAMSTPSMAGCSPRTLPFVFPVNNLLAPLSGTVRNMVPDVWIASNSTLPGLVPTSRPADFVPPVRDGNTVTSSLDCQPSCSSWTEEKMEENMESEVDTVNDYSDDGSCLSPQTERSSGGGKADRCPTKRKTRPIQKTNDPALAKKRLDNREAAQRCRDRKKGKMEILQKELADLREGKGKMQREIDQLNEKVNALKHTNAILETRVNQQPVIFAVPSANFGLQSVDQARSGIQERQIPGVPPQLPFYIPMQQFSIPNVPNDSITARQPMENSDLNAPVHAQDSQQSSMFSAPQFDPAQPGTSSVTGTNSGQNPVYFSVQPPPPYPPPSTARPPVAHQNCPVTAPWSSAPGTHQQFPQPVQMHQLPRLHMRGAENPQQQMPHQVYSGIPRAQSQQQQQPGQYIAVPETGETQAGSTEQQFGMTRAFPGNPQPMARAQHTRGGPVQERPLAPPASQLVRPTHETEQMMMNRHPVPHQTGYHSHQTLPVNNLNSTPNQNQMAQPSSQVGYGTEKDAGTHGSSYLQLR